MNSVLVSLIGFLVILCGAFAGSAVRRSLPKRYARKESKEVIQSAAAMVATLAALVAGLLIATTKSSYDTQDAQIKQISANIVLLDQLLEQYGPDAKATRALLRKSVPALADRIWNVTKSDGTSFATFETSPEANAFLQNFLELTPADNSHKLLYARALETLSAMGQARIHVFAQTRDRLAPPFVIALILWLALVFASYTLFTKLDRLSLTVLILCAFANAGAIFLILEMNEPLSGLMGIPSDPMRNALLPLNQ